MNIVLNNSSQTPLYLQIYEQIVSQILNKELLPDYALPSIRYVARELEISVITIKNAYELLEKNGYIYTIAGKGCFVSNIDLTQTKREQLNHQVSRILYFCKQYDISINEIIKELEKRSQ